MSTAPQAGKSPCFKSLGKVSLGMKLNAPLQRYNFASKSSVWAISNFACRNLKICSSGSTLKNCLMMIWFTTARPMVMRISMASFRKLRSGPSFRPFRRQVSISQAAENMIINNEGSSLRTLIPNYLKRAQGKNFKNKKNTPSLILFRILWRFQNCTLLFISLRSIINMSHLCKLVIVKRSSKIKKKSLGPSQF